MVHIFPGRKPDIVFSDTHNGRMRLLASPLSVNQRLENLSKNRGRWSRKPRTPTYGDEFSSLIALIKSRRKIDHLMSGVMKYDTAIGEQFLF